MQAERFSSAFAEGVWIRRGVDLPTTPQSFDEQHAVLTSSM